jgi:hypothetical protein
MITADWSAWGPRWTARNSIYATCHRRKGWPKKNIMVCQNCRYQAKCKDLAAAIERMPK